ncbi:RNA polymerase sigma factor [Streptomyces sp. NPDC058773]|uniref:RNA polymerase sigma factor n=1 Tax=Streptomyces sp. NPDC058773 TaxID=3346632 RepID=UPI00367F9786
MSGYGDGQEWHPDPMDRLRADFTTFFKEVQYPYLGYAMQLLRNRQDAEDAVQIAGMKIHAKWDEFASHPNLRALGLRVLRDAIKDYLRSRYRANRRDRAAATEAGLHQSCVDQIWHLGTYDALDRAMDELARREPLQAECVRLRVAQLSYEEIAEILGITPGTARTYYSRGRKLAKELAAGCLRNDQEGEPS